MKAKKTTVTFSGETFDLKNALIAGRMDDGTPTSMFSGVLDLDEIHTLLYFANRTVTKMLVEEFNIPLELAEEFLSSAVSEACTQEFNVRARGVEDVEIQKIIRALKKSQN